MMKTRWDNDATDRTSPPYAEKLNCHDRPDKVWYMTKNRHDNNVTNHIGVVYTEIITELS